MIPKEYEKVVTVAAVNWQGEWGNRAANLKKMKVKIGQAAELGVNVVCFPELALSGYECGEEARSKHKPCAMHTEAAETIPGPATEEIAKLAKELDIYVIFGMPEKDAKVQYISAAIVGPEGVIGSYRKIHLATTPVSTERYCFKPGNEVRIFETRYGPIGVQLCADFWMYPELTRILALKGARIIFSLVASVAGPGKSEMIAYVTGAYAQSTQSYIVNCNHIGKERTICYYGHSTIAGPGFPRTLRILAQGGDGEEIVWATLNFETLAHSQKIFRVKEAGNWKLIANEYQKIATSKVGEC